MEKIQTESYNPQVDTLVYLLQSTIIGLVITACGQIPPQGKTPPELPKGEIKSKSPQIEIQPESTPLPIKPISKKELIDKKVNATVSHIGPLGDKICNYKYNITHLCEYKPSKISQYQIIEPQEEIGNEIIQKVILNCVESTLFNQKTGSAFPTKRKCTPINPNKP